MISAVVLSFTLPITLPASGESSKVLIVTAEMVYPDGDPDDCDLITLRFVDGIQGTGAIPVLNQVTYQSHTFPVDREEITTKVCPLGPFNRSIVGTL